MLQDHENIVIAKSDATANEFADFEVEGFPTIIFFPAGEGAEMQDYTERCTLDDFVKFLEPEATEVKKNLIQIMVPIANFCFKIFPIDL